MKFVVLRSLTHSELGMFHEYRRQGKERSKQRAINFDGKVVDRLFPTALDTQSIPLRLRLDTDRGVETVDQWLTRQEKNWRLEGNCPTDRIYRFVEPGCLFAMEVDSGRRPAEGSWVVFPADDITAQNVLADGSTAGLANAGMIALHDEEGRRVRTMLHRARPDMFTPVHEEGQAMAEAPESVAGGKRLPPVPHRLAEIIANTGHTLASAVADLVDNSISADATEIEIKFSEPDGGHGRWLAIKDNGHGMAPDELDQAMTLGSLVEYEGNSLGKFGYGLKGASWSQSRVFTVISRRRGGPISHLTWDRDNLGDWVAGDGALESWETTEATPDEQGTVVLWKQMKPPAAAPNVPGVTPWTAEITELNRHLALVFHRFLDGQAVNRKRITIKINGIPVEPNNPVGHPLVIAFDQKTISIPTGTANEQVTAQAFVLPSEDEIRQYHKTEGPPAVNKVLNRVSMNNKRNESQGLFIYRNDRLIKWGGWHQMWGTSDEKTKLARVVVSFGTKLDERFEINITKRSVSLPALLQEHLKKLATPARNASKAKYSKSSQPKPVSPQPAAGASITGTSAVSAPSTAPFPAPMPPAPAAGAAGSNSAVETTTSEPEETPISLRLVTSTKFGWKSGPNLTGGLDLQISNRFPALAAIAKRLQSEPDGVRELASFLALLDERHVQEKLLDSKDGE